MVVVDCNECTMGYHINKLTYHKNSLKGSLCVMSQDAGFLLGILSLAGRTIDDDFIVFADGYADACVGLN